MADVSMEMSSWSGEWGLPSIDINCLEVLAYAKFAGCPLKVSKHNNPWRSPTWQLPMFTSNSKVLTSSRKIMDFLREKNFNADYQLTAKQGADTLAFMALIEGKLNPALLYTFWVDIQNYRDFTRALYAKRMPIPLSLLVPGQMAKIARNTVFKGDLIEEEHELATLEKKIFKDAMDCLNFLSIKLGENPFFFGESPTTLDAVAFAHLALIWRTPNLPNNKLKNHLMEFENLISFCSRVLQRYFPADPEDTSEQSSTSTQQSSFDDDPYQAHKMWLAIGVAGVSMASYAVLNGLIKVNQKYDKQDDDTDDIDDADYSFDDE